MAFDPEVVHAKYRAERDKRLVPGRTAIRDLTHDELIAGYRVDPFTPYTERGAVTDDPDAARAAAEQAFGRYNGMENYRRLFEREGVASVGDLAVVGTEDAVVTQLARYADLGVTELWPAVYPVGDDQEASVQRTRALLTSLAGP